MDFNSKRKRDEVEPDVKKTKNFINEKEKEMITSSNEWPVYNHPDGGIIKMTPWGSLRQYPNPENGEIITKFEDISFQDYSFDTTNNSQIYDMSMPATPQSLYHNNNNNNSSVSPCPNGDGIKLSPSDEAEFYVMDGYRNQFQQEQENYFGMGDNEEMDSEMS